MTQRPWMKFYPADWQADQALRSVGLEARCLWLECMCIMHRAEPYGHLVVNGRPVTDTQLATLAGAQPDRVPALMAELETAGVTSRSRAGVIYSRRMTRDEKRRKDGVTAKITASKVPGSRRDQAVVTLSKKLATLKVVGKVAEQPPSSHIPEAREEVGSLRSPTARATPKTFEIWYAEYPHKIGSGAAEKAYRAALARASPEVLMQGLRHYIATKPPDRAWCAPAVWLNQKRWLDEPAENDGKSTVQHGRSFGTSSHDSIVEAFDFITR